MKSPYGVSIYCSCYNKFLIENLDEITLKGKLQHSLNQISKHLDDMVLRGSNLVFFIVAIADCFKNGWNGWN